MINRSTITPSTIRALSWKQPYGLLMLHGKIETRTWNTTYQGLVLLCASQKEYSPGAVELISGEFQYSRIIKILEEQYFSKIAKSRIREKKLQTQVFHSGQAFAVGRLIYSRPMFKSDEDKAFVRHYPNLYCHIYTDVTPIKPFPFKGVLGWKSVTQEQIDRIEFL